MKWNLRLGSGVKFLPFILILCCCVNLRYPAKGKPVVLEDNKALVFGRVQVVEDGIDVTRDFCDPWKFSFSTHKLLSFFLLDLEKRGVAPTVIPERDGSFYWVLPRGNYRITKVEYRGEVDPYLAFRINNDNQYIYIGNLALISESSIVTHIPLPKHRGSVKREYSSPSISVEDKYEYETNILRTRFPGISEGIGKSLMFDSCEE